MSQRRERFLSVFSRSLNGIGKSNKRFRVVGGRCWLVFEVLLAL